jgi:hypothetical protein
MMTVTAALYVGWSDDLHADASLNFQLNRWRSYGGPRWFEDVRPLVSQLTSYKVWIDTRSWRWERRLWQTLARFMRRSTFVALSFS